MKTQVIVQHEKSRKIQILKKNQVQIKTLAKKKKQNESKSNEKLTLESLKSQKKVMILDFSQDGWYACAIQHKVLEKLREEYKDRVIIQTINIRKENGLLRLQFIWATLLLFFYF